MTAKFFIAGTDTSAGKTLVTAALLRAASGFGQSCFGLKPVAAGADVTPQGLRNEDALQLQSAASIKLEYALINPYCYTQPVSPHISAQRDGQELNVEQLYSACTDKRLPKSDLCLVEGAGGWAVPINDRESLADLALKLEYPVLLVVGLKLGCINHATLTARAIRASGLRLAGWVATQTEPGMLEVEGNLKTIQAQLEAPMLGFIPFSTDISAKSAAAALDINKLFEIAKT